MTDSGGGRAAHTGLRASAPGPKAKPVVQYDTEAVKVAKPRGVPDLTSRDDRYDRA